MPPGTRHGNEPGQERAEANGALGATAAAAPTRRFVRPLIATAPLAAVAAVYAGAAESEFVAYDDPRYVYANPRVTGGACVDALQEIFAGSNFGTWPVSELSHMLAWELFGDTPAGHHVVNVFLHAANVLLVFARRPRSARARRFMNEARRHSEGR
jgi:hypothetical protein